MNRSITEFHVGDQVVIREWDDMEEQYGTTGDSINCAFVFIPAMHVFCGEMLTISKLIDRGNGKIRVFFNDPLPMPGIRDFTFSTDMIRHVDDPEYRDDTLEVDDAGFFEIIGA